MSRAHRYPKPAEVTRELEEAFIARGFTPEAAAIIADGWGVESDPQTAAQQAVQMRGPGVDAYDIVAWHHVGRDLMTLPLTLAWVQHGYTPTDLITLAWTCHRTTRWNPDIWNGWARADIPPGRAVLYAALSVTPGQAVEMEAVDDPPTEATLRMMLTLLGRRIPELSSRPEREHQSQRGSEDQGDQEDEDDDQDEDEAT